MTARDTYNSSVKNAGPVATQALTNASSAAQESVNAQTVNAGNPSGRGVSAAADAQIRLANIAYQVAQQAAQVARAATEDAAKATLRNSGDLAPF